jgi:hypothetical protein
MIPTPRLAAATQCHSRRPGDPGPDRDCAPTGSTRADKTYLNLGQRLILGHFYHPAPATGADREGRTTWSASAGSWDKTHALAIGRAGGFTTASTDPAATGDAVGLGIWGRCRDHLRAAVSRGRRFLARRHHGRHVRRH